MGYPENKLFLEDCQLQDDFYLNLLGWGSCGLTVGEGSDIVLYSSDSICESEPPVVRSRIRHGERITSVTCSDQVTFIGDCSGTVTMYDQQVGQPIVRQGKQHCARIGVMDLHNTLLATGSRDGSCKVFDVRMKLTRPLFTTKHRQEVCGLKWSPNGICLASGGNDNCLSVYDIRMTCSGQSNQATHGTILHVENAHQAAIKALGWLSNSVLVSGGGTSCKRLKGWHIDSHDTYDNQYDTNRTLFTQDTGSQVCAIITNPEMRPGWVMTTHGFSDNEVCGWRVNTRLHDHVSYPGDASDQKNLNHKVTQMWRMANQHQSRVLYAANRGEWVATGSGDGTIRVWRAFEEEPKRMNRRQWESRMMLTML